MLLSVYFMINISMINTANATAQIPLSNPAHNTITGSINKLSQITQQNIQNNIKQINHWENKEKKYNLRGNQKPQLHKMFADSSECLAIANVYLRGISLLTNKELSSLSQLNDKCYTTNDINRLIKELTLLYIKDGFITARVILSPVNDKHQLFINVIEGKLEKIELSHHLDNPINLTMLFPNMIGKAVNLRQIEQGLDQANRLQSNHVTVSIKPGEHFGTSVLEVKNQTSKPWQVSSIFDNYGQSTTGKERGSLSYSLDNPLGLADYFSIGGTVTLQKEAMGFSRSYNALYSVPYGNFTFNTFVSSSQYGFTQQLPNYPVYLSGHSLQLGLKSDYVFFRDQTNIFAFYAQWINKQSKNYFENEKLRISSFNYNTFELGVNEFHQFDTSNINVNLAIEKGMPELIFDRHPSLNPIEKLADFKKFSTKINYNNLFALKGHIYQLSHHFIGQYSSQDLPSADALSLTDQNAVRGIVNTYLSSGTGAYLQTTLSSVYRLNVGAISPRAGIDLGGTYYHHSHHKIDSALGMSLGVNYSYQYLNIDFMVNKGVSFTHQDKIKEPFQVLAQLAITI